MTPHKSSSLTDVAVLLVAVLLALSGAVLKYARYATPPDANASARVAERITRTAVVHGWEPAVLAGDGRETFAWYAFSRPGCANPMIVAVIKAGGELDSLARSIYGPDVALIDPSEPSATSSPILAPFTLAARRSADVAVGRQASPAPQFAILPAPQRDPVAACAGPPLSAWLDNAEIRAPARLSDSASSAQPPTVRDIRGGPNGQQ